jgi:hypothetical protein
MSNLLGVLHIQAILHQKYVIRILELDFFQNNWCDSLIIDHTFSINLNLSKQTKNLKRCHIQLLAKSQNFPKLTNKQISCLVEIYFLTLRDKNVFYLIKANFVSDHLSHLLRDHNFISDLIKHFLKFCMFHELRHSRVLKSDQQILLFWC